MKFAVVVIAPPGYEHAPVFDEVAEALHYGLVRAGHESIRAVNRCPAGHRPILLGANLIPAGQALPPDSIVFNLEQVVEGSHVLPPAYLEHMRRHKVWDYSAANIAALSALGIKDVQLMPLGYVPELTRITPVEKTIDVLFYGSGNPRRERILHELHARGALVKSVFGVYGRERDELVARSRIVINIHFYETRIFEIVRVSYLLANEAFVVTESSRDAETERELEGGLVVVPYEELVEACMRYLGDEPARRRIARRGFEIFSGRDQALFLARAIEKL